MFTSDLPQNLRSDLLRPAGRTPRARFAIALLLVALSVYLQGVAIRALGYESLLSFFIGLAWTVLNIYMIYTVFARRLHDINLSAGLFFAVILLTLLVLGLTAWHGGLNAYMAAMEANPDIAKDAQANQALIEEYQANLRNNLGWIYWTNYLPFAALALFGLIKPGFPQENKYGPAPTS